MCTSCAPAVKLAAQQQSDYAVMAQLRGLRDLTLPGETNTILHSRSRS